MQKLKLNKRIVITGGGSGGHVSASWAIISKLREIYSDIDDNLLYIGGDLAMSGEVNQKSIEEKELSNKGFKFVKVRAGKLQRAFSLKAIPTLLRTVLGIIDAYRYLKDFKPSLIISTGGFVSLPVALNAKLLNIPLYIHEQTAAIGLTNKIASKIAKKIFVTFERSLNYFPKDKTVVVGNPVRDEIFTVNTDTTPLLSKLQKMIINKKKYPILYISGGGLGSHTINISIRDALSQLLDRYQIILQTGDNQEFKDFDVISLDILKLPKDKQERIIVTKFVTSNEIGAVFNNCNLYIGRSGANTIYELGVLSIPAILIPIPWVTHNEQEENAKVLVKLGTGTIVREGEITRENLITQIEKKLESIKGGYPNISKHFPTDSALRIIEDIFKKS